MKTNASVPSHSDSNPKAEDADRLNILETRLRRMASEHAREYASMARELEALRNSGNTPLNRGEASLFESAEATSLTDRRGMLKKVGAIAAGVAAVGLLRPTDSRGASGRNPALGGQGLAPETNGGNFILGQSNSATSTTLLSEGSPGGSLLVENASATVLNNAPIIGRNYAHNLPVLPAEKVAVFGATYPDGSTTPNDNVAGVYGKAVTSGIGTATGVFGNGTDHGVQGLGVGTNANGVTGSANVGTSAHAVEGVSTTGVGGAFTGARAALFLGVGTGAVPDPNVTAPSGALSGDIYRGSTNNSLWYRASTGYRRLADSTTAGALTAFAASSRFVNLSPLNGGATATYQIGGVAVTGNSVPTKARAIIGRIADANPTGGGGGILVSATNPPPAGTGVLAVTAGAPGNSFFFSALDATGKLYVRNTSPSGSVAIIIDVAGYYE